jgi:SPP1 gp7 family putative phage head morphogenesis protein
MQEGVDVRQGSEIVQRLGDWSRAYADTVYRTNLTSAYTAGRFRQQEGVSDVIGAFGFRSRRDDSTRPNHRAAEGLIAPPHDIIWERLSPPLGYNCRCSLRLVSRFELERLGLLRDGRVMRFEPATLAQAGPDKGFLSVRPDRRIYAA